MKTLLLAAALSVSVSAATLSCELSKNNERIVATVEAERHFERTEPRSVTFYWTTENADWDKRTRTLELPADHSKVWDWRSYEPRPGTVRVTAIIDGKSIEDECVIEK